MQEIYATGSLCERGPYKPYVLSTAQKHEFSPDVTSKNTNCLWSCIYAAAIKQNMDLILHNTIYEFNVFNVNLIKV